MNKSLKAILLGIVSIAMATACDLPAAQASDSSSALSTSNSESQSSASTSESSSDSSSNSSVSSSSSSSESSSSSSTSSSIQSSSSSSSAISSSSSSSASSASSSSSSIPAPTLVGIALNTDNVKKDYYTGEALDLTGLVVTANYSDSSSKAVTNYTTNPANGTLLNEIGIQNVTVSYQSESQLFTLSVTKAPKAAWTSEEAAIMSSHLYGYIFPYTGSEDSAVSYDADENVVLIEGGAATYDDIVAYKDLLLKDSFELISLSPVDTTCEMEKAIVTQEGTRHIYVFFDAMFGEYYIRAYDPYLYSYPTEFVTTLVGTYFDSDVLIPDFPADYYETEEDDWGVFFYTDSTTAEADYKASLKTAGWGVDDNRDADSGYFFAESPDHRYRIAYAYNEEYGDLDVYFDYLNYWNPEVVKDFFKKYNGEVIDIPSLDVEKASYYFWESDWNEVKPEIAHAFMYVYGATESDVAPYTAKCRTAGWTVDEDNDMFYAKKIVEGKGVARFEYNYDSKYQAIKVTIYLNLDPLPVDDIDPAQVKALLGDDITDTIPGYSGENSGYQISSSTWGGKTTNLVMVTVARGTEDDAIAQYLIDLDKAGYTFAYHKGIDDWYVSPNNQIVLCVYMGTPGSFTIEFERADAE